MEYGVSPGASPWNGTKITCALVLSSHCAAHRPTSRPCKPISLQLSANLEMDCSFQHDNAYRRMRRLICFDMDSTLIQAECIDELAERAGVGEEVKRITEQGHARRN